MCVGVAYSTVLVAFKPKINNKRREDYYNVQLLVIALFELAALCWIVWDVGLQAFFHDCLFNRFQITVWNYKRLMAWLLEFK